MRAMFARVRPRFSAKHVLYTLFCLLAEATPPQAMAKVIRVPQDISSIADVNRLASSNDEIIVSPGVYKGLFGIGKSLNIHSIDPTNWEVVNSTIIEGGDITLNQPVVGLSSASNLTIRLAGFTIRKGGGSGIKGGGPNTVIEYCHILENEGGYDYTYMPGAAPYSIGKAPAPLSTVDDRRRGGGIRDCNGTIQNCIIEKNSAEFGGGLASCHGTVQNCIIARNNLVDYGGRGATGAALVYSDAKIRNNTIVDNFISGPGPTGAFVWRGGGVVDCRGEITNNIIWVNRTDLTPEYTSSSLPSYSCIKGWSGGGQGNTAANPRLVNASFPPATVKSTWPDQDWRLRPDSPCIDAGVTTTGLPAVDVYGKARGKIWRTQGTHGDGSHTDMGACEFQPEPLTLWVPQATDSPAPGKPLTLSWALGAGASPASLTVTLLRGGKLQAVLGSLLATSGHGSYETAGRAQFVLPTLGLPTAGNYEVAAESASPLLSAKTYDFTILHPNAIEPHDWILYF